MTRHDCACADYRTIPDSDSLQDNCTSTDPNVISDSHRSADERLFGYGTGAFDSVIVVGDIAKWADKAAAPNLNPFRSIEHGEAVNIGPTAYEQSWGPLARTRC